MIMFDDYVTQILNDNDYVTQIPLSLDQTGYEETLTLNVRGRCKLLFFPFGERVVRLQLVGSDGSLMGDW